jgi:hypothetical protein
MFLRIYSKLMNSASVGCRCGRHRGTRSGGDTLPRRLEAPPRSKCWRHDAAVSGSGFGKQVRAVSRNAAWKAASECGFGERARAASGARPGERHGERNRPTGNDGPIPGSA